MMNLVGWLSAKIEVFARFIASKDYTRNALSATEVMQQTTQLLYQWDVCRLVTDLCLVAKSTLERVSDYKGLNVAVNNHRHEMWTDSATFKAS